MYFNCVLFSALINTEHGFMLIDREIPQLTPFSEFELYGCISQVAAPTRAWTAEEEARRRLSAQQRAALVPPPAVIHAANKRAYAWLSAHKTMREAELAPERLRREQLTKQLRAVCAPAVAEIEKRKSAK